MKYEDFKIAVTAEVEQLAGEGVKVELHSVKKNNGIVLDGIIIMRKDKYMAPTFYLQDFYSYYLKGESISNIANALIEFSLEVPIEQMVPNDFFIEFASVKDSVCFKLIHYEQNKELLKEIPYKQFLDLAIVFYCAVEELGAGQATILIRNTDRLRWGISTEDLFETALKNTPKILPWRFASIQAVVDEYVGDGIDNAISVIDRAVEIVRAEQEPLQMYILTNKNRYFGAACMLYPGLLDEIAGKLEADLFVLPSSIHECIIVPKNKWYEKEELSELVTDINEKEVAHIEILSNNAYFYDRDSQELSL